MSTRRSVLAGLAASILFLGAETEDESPRIFVERIYGYYIGRPASDGVPLETPADVRRLFDPPLATLILTDRQDAATRDEPPMLDGDPFVDAQDWVLSHLDIKLVNSSPNTAMVDVDFDNLDQPAHVRLALVHLADGWRVHEIFYPSVTLSELFAAH